MRALAGIVGEALERRPQIGATGQLDEGGRHPAPDLLDAYLDAIALDNDRNVLPCDRFRDLSSKWLTAVLSRTSVLTGYS